jgi:hypothetical protein
MIDEHFERLSSERQLKTKLKMDALKSRVFFRPPPLDGVVDQQLVWSELIAQVEALGKVLLACAFGSQRLARVNS